MLMELPFLRLYSPERGPLVYGAVYALNDSRGSFWAAAQTLYGACEELAPERERRENCAFYRVRCRAGDVCVVSGCCEHLGECGV